ncbi:uncharacterized protein METZ01_LOCUS147910 [marine metagenome]|uniref:Pyrimidine nucleoside phosphorylase C-terminal domain-containing protein n=1 Tax=marine metagenome TaxID=408172 RepID=A0A382A0L1_9ZZZZ
MTALLMAIFYTGMNEEETFALVDVMLNSGSTLDFSDSDAYVADKHSTGGIGDKVSLILTPIMAASGLMVPMIAGRGLGFTGGTIDKLETIPGFDTAPALETFKDWVKKNGCAIMAQSDQICPADKKIYALRDQTGTVPSVPLICGSIMSKKIAEGISGLVLDIKVGNGAFMKTMEQARDLGSWMKKIGAAFNIETDIIFTNMDQPLGRFAGLACEVQESVKALKGNGPKDLMEVTFELGAKLLVQAKLANHKDEAIQLQQSLIDSGKALAAFETMVDAQGGRLDELGSNAKPDHETVVHASEDGIIDWMDTEAIGWALVDLGCGRKNPGDLLDHSAGIEFLKKVGEETRRGDPVYRVFNSDPERLGSASSMLEETFSTGESSPDSVLILGDL